MLRLGCVQLLNALIRRPPDFLPSTASYDLSVIADEAGKEGAVYLQIILDICCTCRGCLRVHQQHRFMILRCHHTSPGLLVFLSRIQSNAMCRLEGCEHLRAYRVTGAACSGTHSHG